MMISSLARAVAIVSRLLLYSCVALSPGVQAQTISQVIPEYGSPGDKKVTLIGSGFTATTTVRFWNGVVATARSVNSSSSIVVTNVPAGIITGPISVQNSGGPVNYSPGIFTVVGPGPYITGATPTYGKYGDLVTIRGVHLNNAYAVTMAGLSAFGVGPGDADGTLVNAFVPSGNATGPLIVMTPAGTTNAPEPFTVVGAGPYIASFNPTAGADTQPVTLSGVNFAGATAVRFNGVSAPFTATTERNIDATAPVGVTTGPISVTTPFGSYTNPALFYGPVRLSGFSPQAAGVGAQVLIAGTNFTGTSVVKFGGFSGASAAFVVSNNNLLVATVPSNASTGIIVVSTPAGSLPTTSNFVVRPNITGFTPAFGGAGTPVLITGTRLTDNGGGPPVVTFNGTNALVTSQTADQVTVVAPASSSGFITLTTADGSTTSAVPFYYPPQITGLSTNAAPPGMQISIFGQSLTNASSVLFNGVPATTFGVSNNTLIVATVPNGFTTGPITITAPGGTRNSTPLLYYAAPVITAFAPNSGSAGTVVTVFGTSFRDASAVKFNGVNAAFSNVTNNQLTAVVPGGASTGPISVTAPAGTATSAEVFVVPLVADVRTNTFNQTPHPAYGTENLTLVIVPSNDGPNTASNVTAAVTLSPLVRFKSAATQKGTINTNGNPIVFNIGSMTLAENPTLTVVVEPETTGLVTNSVTFSSTTFDPNPANNSLVRVTTVLPLPELNISPSPTNQVRVAWPVTATNFTLQSTPLLTGSIPWSNVSVSPVIEGMERVVTENSTGDAKYYRLKK